MLLPQEVPSVTNPEDGLKDYQLLETLKLSSDVALVHTKLTNLRSEDCIDIAGRFVSEVKNSELVGILPEVHQDPGKILDQLREVLGSLGDKGYIVLLRYDKTSGLLPGDYAEIEVNVIRAERDAGRHYSLEDTRGNRISDARFVELQYGIETSNTLDVKQNALIYRK